MATLRSQAIRVAHDQPVEWENHSKGEVKAEHYGYMARLIHPAVESYLASDPGPSIRNSLSASDLDLAIFYGLLDQIRAQMQTDEYREYALRLGALHVQRVSLGDDGEDLEAHVARGLSTSMHTHSGVYDMLSQGFGGDIAIHQGGAQLGDRIAKLPLEHMLAFSETYLRPEISFESPQNLTAFTDLLEPSADGGVQFKKGFPQAAPIPILKTTRTYREKEKDYRFFGVSRTMPLNELPLKNPAVIGCMITFDPQQVKALWELYTTSRRFLEMRDGLAGTALSSPADTAAPSEQMS